MGNLTLREIKKEVLALLKPKFAKAERASEEWGWLKAVINNLENDLLPRDERPQKFTLKFDENLVEICKKAGLDEYDSMTFTLLWSNPDETPTVAEIANRLGYDRGKTYRTLASLEAKRLVMRVETMAMRYRMTNIKHPFKPLCDKKLEEINHLESLSP